MVRDLVDIGMISALLIILQVGFIGSEDAKIRIITQPRKFSEPVNGNVSLPCRVLNLDDSVVTWTKDGQVISADSFKVLKDSRIDVFHIPGLGVDLGISNLRMGDTGLYKCTVNVNKQDLHIVHKVVVEVPPYIESLNPTNGSITVKKGSRVRLECKAGGQPKPTIYWNRQHNQPLHWKDGAVSIQGEVLELKNISREMAGEYMCNADNGISDVPVWQRITINVLYPPEVSAERSWMHAGQGDDVTLVCTVYANPSPKVSWYKETMKLLEGERIHMKTVGNTHRLSIYSVKEVDYGNYFCKAANQLEEDVTQKFILTGKPSEPEMTGNTEGEERYSYEVKWKVVSSSSILFHEIVYWESDKLGSSQIPPKNGHVRRIEAEFSDGQFKYSLKGLQNNTLYDVIVRSQNTYGWSPFSATLTFRTADVDKFPLEVRTPSETMRPIYQGQKIYPEPVTSAGEKRRIEEVQVLLQLVFCLIQQPVWTTFFFN